MARPTVISLFSGAGGLDLGLEAAGFEVRLCVENNLDARRTLQRNRRWRLSEPGDVTALTGQALLDQASLRRREATLLAAGCPCQPFSKAGLWADGSRKRLKDPRADTFRAFFRVLEETLPKVFVLENVHTFASRKANDTLTSIGMRLAVINRRNNTKYRFQVLHIDAADYGVPQHRRRVFIIGEIHGSELALPRPTHGPKRQEPFRTAWDAIGDLDTATTSPDLLPRGKWASLIPSIPEGCNYLWHTDHGSGKQLFGYRTRYWSFLLKLAKRTPSWTIPASPGPSTGPFHWRNRMLSIEELSRLQTFPLEYKIEGSRRSAQRQLGNAVPSAIGELLGLEIRRQFFGERVRRNLRLIPRHRNGCAAPENVGTVPLTFLYNLTEQEAHPGVGLGPGAKKRHGTLSNTSSPVG